MLFKHRFIVFSGMLGLTVFNAVSHADVLDLGLSNDLAVLSYEMDNRKDFSTQVSILHADVDDHRSNYAAFGFATRQDSGKFRPRLGAKIFGLDGEGSSSAYGIALTAGAEVIIKPKLSINFDVAYAPNILTGGDFDHYYELAADCSYQLIKNGALYLGFRKNQAVSPGYEVYQGSVLGVRFTL